jgi:hypothetical protein
MKIIATIVVFITLVNVSPLCAVGQENNSIEHNTVEDSYLKEWQDHMQELLAKGIFWDFGNNVPTNNWKNTALEIAKKTIGLNSLLADDIKTSFVTTINDKITLENGIHSLFTTQLIAEFNRQIDEWLELKIETVEETKTIIEETPQEIIMTEEIPPTTENTSISEDSSVITTENQENKEHMIAEKKWTDYLENLAQHEYDSNNIEDLIDKAHKLAQETVIPAQSSEQKNRLEKLKNEFKSAIELQSETKGFGGVNPDTIIEEFNTKLEESIVQQPIQLDEKTISTGEQLMTSESSGIIPPAHMPISPQEPTSQNAPVSTSLSTKPIITESKVKPSGELISEYSVVPYYEAPLNSQVTLEKEQEEIERQKTLKQAVVTQIKQKAEFDAEKKEKQTLVASLMEKFFYVDIDDWFKSNEKKPAIEIVPEIIETILRAEQDTTKRTNKKNAYMQFQRTLLSFNNKTFWDSKNNRPLQSWVDKIKTECASLINYKMITIKQAIDIVDQALQISGKIADIDKQAIKNRIKDFLETIAQSLITEKK